mmetsp:Transcript_24516/g.57112  ORF Transcript_24516/g.57112 Transcript_24516/m.57112 type:complete len:215 (-) Transcript_24516:265-909(-)|eukprot:CAMPEP_0116830944 /NCGR_PEP_ID=MMETSP0418-20121206/5053_1 /TAXON_ID=1158023 /ORGANISM="Astrosyne radiata, Strain 13vi08-1A" /LENGTH=214 /DNA_ID=CAMNT_0004460121 /DNA_START=74 /DNA_END=718 /DNA_ORIENTATION=+
MVRTVVAVSLSLLIFLVISSAENDFSLLRGEKRRLENARKGKKDKNSKEGGDGSSQPFIPNCAEKCIPFAEDTDVPSEILVNPDLQCSGPNDCAQTGANPCEIELLVASGRNDLCNIVKPCFCYAEFQEGGNRGETGSPPVVVEPNCVNFESLPPSVVNNRNSICNSNADCNQWAPSAGAPCRLFLENPNAIIATGYLYCDISSNFPEFPRLCD